MVCFACEKSAEAGWSASGGGCNTLFGERVCEKCREVAKKGSKAVKLRVANGFSATTGKEKFSYRTLKAFA